MVCQYKDPRLIYIRRSVNAGPGANYGEALIRAKGDYILISHDDDIMYPELIQCQLQAFSQYPDAVLVATNVSLINSAGETIQHALYDSRSDRFFQKGDFLRVSLDEGFWLPAPTFMIRRHLNGKNRDLRNTFVNLSKSAKNPFGITGDAYSALHIHQYGSIVFLGTPLLAYRQHQEQHNFNDDQVSPQVPFYRCVLKHLCQKRKVFSPYTQEVAAYLLRYQMQEILLRKLTSYTKAASLLKKFQPMELRLIQQQYANSNPDYYTQFALIMHLLGGSSRLIFSIPPSWFDEPATTHHSAFRKWFAFLSVHNHSLSSSLSKVSIKKVAILGSLLNAATIALDCYKNNIEVVGFLDSNRIRTGKSLAGLPIIPIDNMAAVMNKVDLLIFSSERRSESSLKQYIQRYIPSSDLDRCVSWMTLAAKLSKVQKGDAYV